MIWALGLICEIDDALRAAIARRKAEAVRVRTRQLRGRK